MDVRDEQTWEAAGRTPRRADNGLAWLSGLVAFGLAATMLAISYTILRDYAEAHEYAGWVAWAWPTGLDGLMVVASLAVLDAARRGRRDWYALALVGVGIVASLAFNVAHARTLGGRFAAVVPPTTAALALELFLRRFAQQRARQVRAAPVAAPTPEDHPVGGGGVLVVPAARAPEHAADGTPPPVPPGSADVAAVAVVAASPDGQAPAGVDADGSAAGSDGAGAAAGPDESASTADGQGKPEPRHEQDGSVTHRQADPAVSVPEPGRDGGPEPRVTRSTYRGRETAKARTFRLLERAQHDGTLEALTVSDVAEEVGCSSRYAASVIEEWGRARRNAIAHLAERIARDRAAGNELAAHRATHELVTRYGPTAMAAVAPAAPVAPVAPGEIGERA